MRGVAGLDVVQLGKHRDHCRTRYTCHCGDEQNVGVIQSHNLCQQTKDDGEYNQFNTRMEIQSSVFEHIRKRHGCQQSTRYKNRDGRAERAEIVEKLRKCIVQRREKASRRRNDVGLQQEQKNTNGAGNCAVVDKNLFWREFDIVTLAREDHNTPRPNKNVEEYNVECPHKATDAIPKDGIKDREADEPCVCKHEREFKYFCSVKVAFPHRSANKERHCRHQEVHHKTDQEHLPSGSQIFLGKLDVVQRSNDHHRLPDGNDEARECLGCLVVNDFCLAANVAADHEEKECKNDGEQAREEVKHPSFPQARRALP